MDLAAFPARERRLRRRWSSQRLVLHRAPHADVHPPDDAAFVATEALPGAAPADLASVARNLGVRPPVVVVIASFVAACAAHALVGTATQSVRATKHAQETSTATAVSVEAPLPEEALPAPPPPAPPPSKKSAPALTKASSSTANSSPLPSLPSLSGTSLGGGGPSMAVTAGSSSSSAPPASTSSATATAAPQPTVTPAKPLSRTPPRFPPRAQRDGVTGVVVVQLHITVSGVVDDVRVVEADPAGVFDEAALDAVRRWTFTPATSDGAPVASWLRQTVRFRMDDT